MKRKLLFFDIDGTLLAGGYDGYIPESTLEALKKAQENGHYCFVNTGRTRSFIPKELKQIPFDGFVFGCGTEVVFQGETIYRKVLTDDIKRALPKKAEQANVQIVAEGPYHIYYDENIKLFPETKHFLDFYDTFGENSEPGHMVKTFREENLNFSKFVIVFDKTADIPLFKELISPEFAYIPREKFGDLDFSEIVPTGCSKASGIDRMVEHLGLELDDCYVFGDSNNDLSMLTHVKHSIAMGNASEEVLKIASMVTKDIDHDGIYHAMKSLELI